MAGRGEAGEGVMTKLEHAVTVTGYEWILGTRWRWDCRCGRGAHGYTSEEAAREYADEHPESAAAYQAMWDRAEERQANLAP